jgi:hypothetical protein
VSLSFRGYYQVPVMSEDNEKKSQQHDLSGQSWCDDTRNVLLGHIFSRGRSLSVTRDRGRDRRRETE